MSSPSFCPLKIGGRYLVISGSRVLQTRSNEIYRCEVLPDEPAPALVLERDDRKPTKILRDAEKVLRLGVFIPCDELLPYPLEVRTQSPKGKPLVSVYQIPPEDKASVLAAFWPFKDKRPKVTQWMFDLHADKWFRVSEYLMVRETEKNWIVSPFYFESGGTALDWFPHDPSGSSKPPSE